MEKFRILLLTTAMAAPLSFANIAMAQDISPTANSGNSEDEIVVTARRRNERLQDVPVSVTVATAVDLERQGIEGTVGLTDIVPNLQFATYGTLTGNNSAAQVFIRGIGQTDATAGVDPGVGIYIDDVYMARSVGGAMDFRDIASTQVLRGPQGTLFGRNTIGGAVLMTTNKPGAGSTVKLGVGTDNLFQGFAAVDLTNTDQFGARASFGIKKRDGYVQRVFDDRDFGDDNTYTGQLTLNFKPSDKVEFTLRGDYSEEDENGSPFVFLEINENSAFPRFASLDAGCPGIAPFPVIPGVPTDVDDPRCANDFQNMGEFTNGGTAEAFSTLENMGIALTTDLAVSDNFSLKSITSYRELDWTGARDADNTPLTILSTIGISENSQFSQELRGSLDLDSLNGVFGAYYFEESTYDEFRATLGTPFGGSYDSNQVNLDSEAFALFTDWTYDISEALSLSAGIRYTSEEKTLAGSFYNVPGATSPDPGPPSTLCPTVGAPTAGCLFLAPGDHTVDFDSVTISGNASYRFSPGFMGYASYSQGFKSGGFNRRYNSLLQADGTPLGYDEETAESIELGFKANPDASLRLNGAVFSNSYDDIQLTYRVGPAPLLFNAGKATIKGAELELYYSPTDDFTLDASVGLLDAKLDEVATVPNLGAQTPSATTAVDNQLPRAPDFEGHIGASYTFAIGNNFELTPRLDVTHRSSLWFDAANGIGEGSTTTSNGSITLANPEGNWRLILAGNNLTDETYLLAGTTSASTATGYTEGIYARPRNATLTFIKDF